MPNHKFVDFDAPDSGSTDRQPTNSERANGQCANRDSGKRQRPNRLCRGTDRREMNGPGPGVGSIPVGDACITFTRWHQLALDCWVDSGGTLRGLTLPANRRPAPMLTETKPCAGPSG